jgi:hypothetical protein
VLEALLQPDADVLATDAYGARGGHPRVRVERRASSREEVRSSLQELNAVTNQHAASAGQAQGLTERASADAEKGRACSA